jgi:quercetin dioxygenase-like cupin family protein
MKAIPPDGTTKGSGDKFKGDVYFDVVIKGEPPSRIQISSVHFTPGAHTAWHRHAVGQYLHVTEGTGLVQERDGETKVLRPGDTIYTPPNTWHWHGATKDHFMTHLAIWELPESGDGIEWGAHITDAEYNKQPKI